MKTNEIGNETKVRTKIEDKRYKNDAYAHISEGKRDNEKNMIKVWTYGQRPRHVHIDKNTLHPCFVYRDINDVAMIPVGRWAAPGWDIQMSRKFRMCGAALLHNYIFILIDNILEPQMIVGDHLASVRPNSVRYVHWTLPRGWIDACVSKRPH